MTIHFPPELAAQIRFAAMLSEQTPEDFCREAIEDALADVAAVMEGAWPRPGPDLGPIGIFRPDTPDADAPDADN